MRAVGLSVFLIVAALVSWGIAFFEYMLQVPGNRIGYTALCMVGAVYFMFRGRLAGT